MLRSLLFVPGDRPERFAKAAASGADAIILDLEDSVALAAKPAARAAVAGWLGEERICPAFVRVNALDSGMVEADLAAVLPGRPDGIMLPKAEGAASVDALWALMGGGAVPVLPIAAETPAGVFALATYKDCVGRLAGLTWGAEDLPASIGAAGPREAGGSLAAPFETARSMVLFAAHAAGVEAIETVFPDIADAAGLAACAARARRHGFTGMMAIHPVQVGPINAAFTPGEDELARAREIVALFAADPGVGVVQLRGKMVDRPHLRQAQAMLARAGEAAQE